ncbi:MAG: hypothetical protein LH467_14350, partial [Gemmatimonadaceae bacterium]|nr:hypothetical protein [Gemmatimonadaceae bacterium]
MSITGYPGHATAQRLVTRVSPELRSDVILGDRAAVHVGAGVQVPLGIYVRLGLIGAAGRLLGSDATRPPGPARARGPGRPRGIASEESAGGADES